MGILTDAAPRSISLISFSKLKSRPPVCSELHHLSPHQLEPLARRPVAGINLGRLRRGGPVGEVETTISHPLDSSNQGGLSRGGLRKVGGAPCRICQLIERGALERDSPPGGKPSLI